MYRPSAIYEEIKKVIVQVYLDYDIKKFPIDEKEICSKLNLKLIPYSQFKDEQIETLKRKSQDGFLNRNLKAIFYNDITNNKGRIRFTIFHEIKHFLYEDENDADDDLADYFARYFMCPIPYVMKKGFLTASAIESAFDISYQAACNVLENVVNRKNSYGDKLFDYEVELINHLEPELINN